MEMKEAKRIAREIKKNCKKLTVWKNYLLNADSIHVTPQEFVDMIKMYDTQEVICWPAPAGEVDLSKYYVGFSDGTDKIKWYSTMIHTEGLKLQPRSIPVMVPVDRISIRDCMEKAATGKLK